MARIPPSDAAPHHLVRGAVGIARISGGRLAYHVVDLAFETRSLLSQFIVSVKGGTQVREAIRIRNIRSTLARCDRFTGSRVVARLDLQNSQAYPVADIAQLSLPPVSLVDRGGS